MNISNNRRFLNNTLLPSFIGKLKPKSVVVDIGKSFKWSALYANMFKDFQYLTIDRDINTDSDLLLDIENTQVIKCNYSNFADAILCHGVIEQCDNPFTLTENIHTMIKDEGIVLFGIASVGHPIYEKDYYRLTEAGAVKLIDNFFIILEKHPIFFNDTLEYIFILCKK